MNKKRLFGAFLIITSLIVMLLPAAEADAGTSASAFTIKGGKLTAYKGADRTVSVPGDVTVIGEGAFEDNDIVQKIILSDSVKKIEAYAFWGCDNLETVVLGKGLTTIDDYAFINCDGLETMTIPSNIRSIGIQAFADCDSFEDITIPPEVTDIREDAFDGDYLLNIHCETGSYADKYARAFYERQKNMVVYTDEEAEKESEKIEYPADGVYSGADADDNYKEEDAYYDILGELFGSTTVVDNQAVVFMQNAGLPVQNGDEAAKKQDQTEGLEQSQTEKLPADAITKEPGVISERAYYRDDSLTEAVVDEDIHTIAGFAYARSGLKEISLPDSLEEIGYAAFYHCDDLTLVKLPDGVRSVADKAFAHTAWVENFLAGGSDTDKNGDFLISGGVLVAYRGDAQEVVVPENVRVIAGGAFEDHMEIKSVVLPKALENIDEDAFAGCRIEKVDYSGEVADKTILEMRVNLNTLSEAPDKTATSPFIWILAVAMLLVGSVFLFRKEKY